MKFKSIRDLSFVLLCAACFWVTGCMDTDGDGVNDALDNCAELANADQANRDDDGVGDACDNCPEVSNGGQEDGDDDGAGDACDDDDDGDGLNDEEDPCPNDPDPNCDAPSESDLDRDRIVNERDNCPTVANNDQADTDDDGLGDACDENPPIAVQFFPQRNRIVRPGTVTFQWSADSQQGEPVQTVLFVGRSPNVFDDPTQRETILDEGGQFRQEFTFDLGSDETTYYWGIEITDGLGTVRQPPNGMGLPFQATLGGLPPVQGVNLECPLVGVPARSRTTFEWTLDDPSLVPTRTTLLIGRSGMASPFELPLRVLEVDPPTALSRTLTDAEALPIGRELSWGLRIEQADGTGFTALAGEPITIAENVLPTGRLLAPANERVLADNTENFVLLGNADSGNCEDALIATVYLEQLGNGNVPTALFSSPMRFDFPIDGQFGGFELDLVPLLPQLSDAGRWAWGAQADDGTDRMPLDNGLDTQSFRTFLRDPSPRFTPNPALRVLACADLEKEAAAVQFGFEDLGGTHPLLVNLYYATSQRNVFSAPSATSSLDLSSFGLSRSNAFFFVNEGDSPGCPVFAHGLGVYGVELDDGINDPVRAMVSFLGPDCNENGVPDSMDIADGRSRDCDGNGVPDECELSGRDCNANGTLDDCELDGNDCNENGVPDGCELSGNDANANGRPDDCDGPMEPPFKDCNGNEQADSLDIAQGNSQDCDRNGVPDECQDLGVIVDAGTLQPGTADLQDCYCTHEDGCTDVNNDLNGRVCGPILAGFSVSWELISAPQGTEVFFQNEFALFTFYSICPGRPGEYTFRLTVVESDRLIGSDTVILTLR